MSGASVAATSRAPSVRLEGIHKAFRHVRALRGADLEVKAGEIHAVVGENGAGKSTLMNVLFGLYEPDAGTLRIGDRLVTRHSPNQAVSMGIGMVHQHFMLVEPFSVLENVILGIEKTQGPFLDPSEVLQRLDELGRAYGLAVDPMAAVESLPVSMQQRVEILKVLVRGAKVLVMDEPTAVLTPQEVDELFNVLRRLREQGSTVLLITHKLREVKALSDRLTVMREGATVATRITSEVTQEEIASLMVGRPVLFQVVKPAKEPGRVLLELEGLTVRSPGRPPLVDGATFSIRAGEILGLAGVTGNGQTELVRALVGLEPEATGRVVLDGADLSLATVLERFEAGLAHIPEDRLTHAVVPDFTVAENLVLGRHHLPAYRHGPFLDHDAIEAHALEQIKHYDVRPGAPDQLIRQLSGGNQQKVVIAREVGRHPKVLVASMPTRGVDIGAIEFIHKRLIELRGAGVAILLVSSELSEILSLSDRIAVICQGKIVRVLPSAEATESALGLAMAGVS